jgi:hypothetical protein
MKYSQFLIENDCSVPIAVAIEPEGMIMNLPPKASIVVKDEYDISPVTVRLSDDGKGGTVVCIWPGDGDTKVEKDGVNVLEFM